MRRALSSALMVTFIAATLAGLYNVYSDNRAVEAKAAAAACAAQGKPARCRPLMTRLLRTPVWQDITYRVDRETVDVRCARGLWFFGEYDCAPR